MLQSGYNNPKVLYSYGIVLISDLSEQIQLDRPNRQKEFQMASNYSVQISNEQTEVAVTGRISKIRPGEGNMTGKVVNVSMAVSRRYPEMKDGQAVMVDGKASWKEVTSFIDMALWGKSVEFFHANVGDVATAGFSLADMVASPYTKGDGTLGANLKVGRANYIKIIARKIGASDQPTPESVPVDVPEEVINF
jgi:hypothetical protein